MTFSIFTVLCYSVVLVNILCSIFKIYILKYILYRFNKISYCVPLACMYLGLFIFNILLPLYLKLYIMCLCFLPLVVSCPTTPKCKSICNFIVDKVAQSLDWMRLILLRKARKNNFLPGS